MLRTRIDWFVVITAVLFAVGCGGGGCGGCGGMEPIPGGFPLAKRTANAGQIRVTQSAIAKITADPAGVLGPLAGAGAMNGVISFAIPASCGGNPSICCPNGQPSASCGPLLIDFNKQTGDADRLVIAPVQNASRVDVTVRARVKTAMKLPITYSGINCDVTIDTTKSSPPADLKIDLALAFTQDPTIGTTRVNATNVTVSQLDSGDVTLSGNFLCQLGGSFIGAFTGTLQNQIASQIQNTINDGVCKACDSGNVADCGQGATACTNKVCMSGNACMQELGIDGRLRGSTIFASISPGTNGALDMYEVAGGYATTNNSGIALGLLGGMLPGGTPRDRCGPPATEPAPVTIAQSNFFQGNTRPDTNAAFDVGFGLHKSQLDQLAYGGYDGGLFCLTVGSSTVAQLSTDTLSLVSRSLGKLVESNSAMAVGVRPQKPPAIVLGKNTFKDDGSGTMIPDNPLLDITFQGLEIDFFASVDEQWIRVFTVVADVHLPIGLQTSAMGELVPVIGSTDNAFTNISVKNSEAVSESPAALAGLFPTLLNLVLPQLSGALSPISLPTLGGLKLSITDVTAVDSDQFLAIFANLVPATAPRIVDTTAELTNVVEPSVEIAKDPARWRGARPTAITLALGGTSDNLEFSWRTNGGSWSGWSTNRHPTIAPDVFWLPGVHHLEVRAREIGRPETIDPEPVMIELPIGTDVPLSSGGRSVLANAGFHGQAGASGCSCQTASPTSGALFALVIGGLVLVPRRRRRKARRHGSAIWLTVLALLPGCDCGGSAPCGDTDCIPGDVDHGMGGRWTSIAGDSKRVLVATYDNFQGDLMVVDATDPNNLKYRAVDGIPDETPTHDPGSYRGGVESAGPNVGAWTSIALEGGIARVAYQDRDTGSLKYAYETKANGDWKFYTVDTGDAPNGLYASMVIDADKRPAIAYLAFGVDDGMGHRNTELRLVRAGASLPKAASDWTSAVIATAPGSCGGLCGSESCVAGVNAGDPQVCVAPTTDCTATCGDTEVCYMGACRARVDEPKVATLPGGTGLYVSLVVLPDGRLAAAYYDMNRRALVLAAEATKGANDFAETILDGNVAGADRGMWSSAAVGDDGTVYVAYQDALGDQLMYTTWNGTAGTPVIVDDGQRTGDRTHPVGAAGAIYLVGGAPQIAYQDGLVSDVVIASQSGSAWTVAPFATGTLLDGWSIAVTTGHGSPVLAWGSIDPAQAIPMSLAVRAQ